MLDQPWLREVLAKIEEKASEALGARGALGASSLSLGVFFSTRREPDVFFFQGHTGPSSCGFRILASLHTTQGGSPILGEPQIRVFPPFEDLAQHSLGLGSNTRACWRA